MTPAERAALIADNDHFALHQARKWSRRFPRVDLDDLRQAARMGLMDAAERYDPTKGMFTTIAAYWVRNHITQCIDKSRTIHIPVFILRGNERNFPRLAEQRKYAEAFMNVSSIGDDIDTPDRSISPLDAMIHDEDRMTIPFAINQAIERLEETHAEIIRRLYGIGLHEPEPLKVVARRIGWSCGRTYRARIKSLAMLRRILGETDHPKRKASTCLTSRPSDGCSQRPRQNQSRLDTIAEIVASRGGEASTLEILDDMRASGCRITDDHHSAYTSISRTMKRSRDMFAQVGRGRWKLRSELLACG